MGKPWARIEIGYLSHPKFLALSAHAICLWHEGKNYCAMHHTDGFIPKHALKAFRFGSAASVSALLKSCGEKPNGEPYGPLWEDLPTAYHMHDYLEHNDPRERVLNRIEKANNKREADRERLRKWREARKRETETPDETPLETPFQPAFQKRFRNANETRLTDTDTDTDKRSVLSSALPPKPAPHPIKAFLAQHERLFEARFNQKPAKYGGRDAKTAKQVIDRYGEAEAGRLLERFMASADPFIVKAGFGLNVFESQINKLLVDQAPVRNQAGTDDATMRQNMAKYGGRP